MSLVISDIKTDLPKLNSELQRLDALQQQLTQTQKALKQQTNTLHRLQGKQTNFTAMNNLVFVWANPVLSWISGWIRDTEGKNYPVAAGSRSDLTDSEVYWLGWNESHGILVADHDLSVVSVPNNLTICRVTLTTGTVGCGGSDPGGVGANGKEF